MPRISPIQPHNRDQQTPSLPGSPGPQPDGISADRYASQARPQKIALRPLGADDHGAVLALAVAPAQAGLVAPNHASLATIAAEPASAGRVILADDEIVGLMVYETLAAEGRPDEVSIYRVMIDARHQRRGIGTAALELLLAELAEPDSGFTRAWISAVPENRVARDLYARLGFVESGLDEDGEIRAVAALRR